jgi:UTP--glucose-1-phosphate uridylyltransferase
MSIIKTCLFPAAGYATRFLPVTKAIPKEMLPIVDTPLIQYAVEEAKSAGCSNIGVITNKYKKTIEDYFDTHTDIETSIKGSSKEQNLKELNHLMDTCKFSFTRQYEMKGLGHAILTGQHLVGNEPFAVILPDDLCYNDDLSVLQQMTQVYVKNPNCCIVAVEEICNEDTNKYGIIAGKSIDNSLIQVTDMIEKPDPKDAPSNLAIIGRYILTPEIFDVINQTLPDKGGEIQITDALLTLAKKGKVIAYKFNGKRFDCGSVKGFIEATNYFFEKR